jgi:hypothetical protein
MRCGAKNADVLAEQKYPPEKKKPKLSHIKREKKNRSNQNKKLFYNFKEKKRKSQKNFFLTFLS